MEDISGFVLEKMDSEFCDIFTLSRVQIRNIDYRKGNNDDLKLFIWCTRDDCYMDFRDEYWICPVCHSITSEITHMIIFQH